MSDKSLTHLDEKGRPHMVEVGEKIDQKRTAWARGEIYLQKETLELISANAIKKGNVLNIAETAGIMAAKKTWDLIPLCHPLTLTGIKVKASLMDNGIAIESCISCIGKTGVEMEALQAVSSALLTVYDMCKAVDKEMEIGSIRLQEKRKENVTL